MFTLYLLRHADAEPAKYYDDDRERELSASGREDAQRLGQFLLATDQYPEQVVTSTAVRARQTADALSEGEEEISAAPLRPSHNLYRAQPADVLDAIRGTSEGVGTLLLVGHEPTWSTTVSQLVGAANVSLPTGTCVRIDMQGPRWNELSFGDGTLRWMVPPKLLR